MSRHVPKIRSSRKGVALLLVLGIIMAITILSLGFVARCDTELACGQNMAIRVQMDQLAASGLEHARGLLLNPQEVAGQYWTGGTGLQLDPNTNDFYDVTIDANDECTFDAVCEAYRLSGGEKVGASSLAASIRLDPAIGVWSDEDLHVHETWTVTGDVYTAGSLVNFGSSSAVDGDVFAGGLTGGIVGVYKDAASLTLDWPPVTSNYDNPAYSNSPIGPGTVSGTYSLTNIWKCTGDLILDGATVNGMLLVDGNLIIQGSGTTLTAVKNMPAVYVTGDLILHTATNLRIEGLVAVDGDILVGRDSTDLHVLGGLFTKGCVVETAVDSSGAMADAAVQGAPVWSASGLLDGAFEFDGEEDYLRTRDDSTSLQLSGDYTLSVWMKPDASQKTWAGIICKTNASRDANHWVLQFDDSSGRELVVGHGAARWHTGRDLADLVGAWHHVAVVRDGTTMRFYLDGVEEKSDYFASSPASGYGHLHIGADRTGLSSYLYAGLLDDVRVYNRALLAAEISALPDDASLIGHWAFDGSGSQLEVVASPTKAAIAAWPSGTRTHWSPAGGAFFKRIDRE